MVLFERAVIALLISKHSMFVSSYDCSSLLCFSTSCRSGTYCSAVRHLVARNKTVSSPPHSLEVYVQKKAFFPSSSTSSCDTRRTESRSWVLLKHKQLSWQQQHLKRDVSLLCWLKQEWTDQDLWTVAAALSVRSLHDKAWSLLSTAGVWRSGAEHCQEDRNILTKHTAT